MNPDLGLLQPYPFERLRQLFAAPADLAAVSPRLCFQGAGPVPSREIKLSIGEPQHATPAVVTEALARALPTLAHYPTTQGSDALREAIAGWAKRRFALTALSPQTQVLPVNGSREALFAFVQTVIDRHRPAKVICPNPFYQVYEGAALLAGAQPLFLDTRPEDDFAMDWDALREPDWAGVQLVFVCSPGNPTGKVLSLDDWRRIFELADRHGFIVAADECYSEIYFDEAAPPLGALTAAQALGRDDYRNLVVFHSLSKRSNVPGMRSGFVAGDAKLVGAFLRYRTYHGCAMNPAVQAASAAAWDDEGHVRENRRLYARKFAEVTPRIARLLPCAVPDAGFYLWADTSPTGLSDTEFALGLARQQNVVVLPGSFLARQTVRGNPGSGFVRMALVAQPDDCIEAAARIEAYCSTLKRES